MVRTTHLLIAVLAAGSLIGSACSSDSTEAETPSASDGADGVSDAAGSEDVADSEESANDAADPAADSGIRLVSATEGAAIQDSPPEDLVILDVRTPEEFADGHLEGAVMVDFYDEDFADQLAELDPNVPYLLYCRSGNRSGQTAEIMADLGFGDVADVDGGIVAWTDAGLPTVAG